MILRFDLPNRKLSILLLVAGVALSAAACGEEAAPEAYRETVNGYTVVHLYGTPYEMGAQHARLLATELKAGVAEIQTNPLLKATFALAKQLGLDKLAAQRSYPELFEECKGLVSVAG